ncbi:hypothetical protein KQX54_009049 [Cotesia glomerata]|uniref:Uncharacterized protein n=1 Tax=Cotesia glomerata TaxID=32391 RepID=A0AAV7I6L6_COTGL|nr:hypothetical protein KQX54_009049 [Cotesia glomerata]
MRRCIKSLSKDCTENGMEEKDVHGTNGQPLNRLLTSHVSQFSLGEPGQIYNTEYWVVKSMLEYRVVN